MTDLASLLNSSRQLTAHITRPDLPQINLGIDQIEQQSRRLVSAQPPSQDPSKANFLLAQAQINAPTLASQIASLNTQTTFAPLQPLSDTDIPSFLRHAHEQSLISAIEEGRRETENEFYRVLDERTRRDWESRKKKIFEELGVASAVAVAANAERDGMDNAFGRSRLGALGLGASKAGMANATSSLPKQTLPMHHKMMAYDGVITQLNNSRRAAAPFPLVSALIETARSTSQTSQNRAVGEQYVQVLQILANVVDEGPAPPVSHAAAHLLNNNRVKERQFASAYLGSQANPDARELRQRIVDGARKSLEEQYWAYLQKVIDSRMQEAAVGGDPSLANKVRGFLSVQFYKSGRWEERLELVAAKPLWAQIFYLVRTGHHQEALQLALENEKQLNDREPNFVTFLRTWIENDRRMPRQHLDRLLSSYNSRIAFTANPAQADPFKAALFKLMGKIEPHKKSLGIVTSTKEDWIWFQLMMIDEHVDPSPGLGMGGGGDSIGQQGLRDLADVLESYGERHFAGEQSPAALGASSPFIGASPSSAALANSTSATLTGQTNASKKLAWAKLLFICGLFEKSVASMYEHPELQIEAVHLGIALSYYGLLRVPSREEMSEVDILIASPTRPTALNFALLIARYTRQFQKTDPKEALQYAYCIALHADRPTRSLVPRASTLMNSLGPSNSLFRPTAVASPIVDDDSKDSKFHLDIARDLVRMIIVGCEGRWDELIGGFKPDGSKYDGVIKHDLHLLRLTEAEYTDVILMQAAQQCEASRRILDAIKLYNLAGAQDTVMSCLSRALGELLSEPGGGGEEGRELEELARNVLHYYENTHPMASGSSAGGDSIAAAVLGSGPGRLGRDGEDVKKLIRVRWAMEAYEKGDLEAALNAIEQSQLVSLDGDIQTISRKMDEFKAMDASITRNLGEILILTMNILHGLHSRVKSGYSATDRDDKLVKIRKRARALMTFAGMQKYSLSADVYGQLTRLEVMIAH